MRRSLSGTLMILSCVALVSLGGCKDKGSSPCGNGRIDDEEQCDASELAGATCVDQGYSTGELACTDLCTFDVTGCCDHSCYTVGEQRCDGDVLQECAISSGCREWTVVQDCAAGGEVCDDGGALPVCGPACLNNCPAVGEVGCSGTAMQTCELGALGCLQWSTTSDCADTDEVCQPLGGSVECMGSGRDCAHVRLIPQLPYVAEGADFAADFDDVFDYAQTTGCSTYMGSSTVPRQDAVFSVALLTGDDLVVRRRSQLSARFRIAETCDATMTCVEEWTQFNGGVGYHYIAPNDGTYYIFAERSSGNEWEGHQPYRFEFGLSFPEDCGDGLDNDFDLLMDCADDDCYGDATHCATESYCGDGADNDLDGLTDCGDGDCVDSLRCRDNPGLHEFFENSTSPGEGIDLEGCSILFTPDATDHYSFNTDCTDVSQHWIAPGTGVRSTPFMLGDDDFELYTLQTGWSFPFFGASFDRLFVGSNGYLTFEEGDNDCCPAAGDRFSHARIAPLFTDVDQRHGGTITLDEFADHVVLTYADVWDFGKDAESPSSFQAVLHESGEIRFNYLAITWFDHGITGVMNGSATALPSPEVDFAPQQPPQAGEVIFTEIQYSPTTVADADGEWIELAHVGSGPRDLAGCELTHGGETLTLPGDVSLSPGDHLLVMRNNDPLANGGYQGQVEWPGMDLGHQAVDPKDFTLTCGGVVVDTVDFGTSGPYPGGVPGVALQLNPIHHDAAANDDPSRWCPASRSSTGTDLGTPGWPNDFCLTERFFHEDFTFWPPVGMSVIDNALGTGSSADTWLQCGACTMPWAQPLLSPDGLFALVDSEAGSGSEVLDEALETYALDCSSYAEVHVRFLVSSFIFGGTELATLEVSTDGGATWDHVLNVGFTGRLQWDVSEYAAGHPDVRFRWYFHSDSGSLTGGFLAIDDVELFGF